MLLPETLFRGAYTPLITPFRDGRVDYGAYVSFIDWQIREGANGIVVAGTSGEPMALTVGERKDLLRVATEVARQRVPVIAATGAASFADTLDLTEHAASLGVAGTLIMTPPFAKPPQRGLVEYFVRLAQATPWPVLLYQIPSRTNATLTLESCRTIVEAAPNVIGMKQSEDDRYFVREALASFGPEFRVFMGLSDIAWDMLGQGACGLIVALSNVVPSALRQICDFAREGKTDDALTVHDRIAALNDLAFSEQSPIPVKYMAWRMGLIPTLEYRLPLGPPSADLAAQIDDALAAAGYI